MVATKLRTLPAYSGLYEALKEKIVSTVIECPECCTRYKMNKAIPEGGRYVKCARCGHQWRVSPEMPLDEEAGTQGAHQNIVEDEQPAVSSAEASEETTEATQASMPFPPPPPPDAPSDEMSDWETRREFHAFAVSSMQDDQQDEADSGENHESAMLDSNALKNAWMGLDDDAPSPPPQEDGFNHMPLNGAPSNEGAEWAPSLQEQPWNNVDEQGEEDPENAIRSALSTALEHQTYPQEPLAQTQQQTLATEQDPAAVEEEPFNEFWEGFAAEREETDLHSDAPAYGDKDMKTVAAEIQSARRNSVIYDAATARDGFAEEDEQYASDADAMADLALQQNMAEALRAAAPQNDEPFGKQGPASYDDDNLHGDEFHYGAEYFDDNTPALRNQLENIEHMPYEAPRQGGGLLSFHRQRVFASTRQFPW
ncbi:MAG: zinc-ribbon domain-containing protein [Alphaproteobacteria bacterium]